MTRDAEVLCPECGRTKENGRPACDQCNLEKLLTVAELGVSQALSSAKTAGLSDADATLAELVREALSLARTLVSSAKLALTGGTVNRLGFVQGSGSRVDVLCCELVIRRELERNR